MEICIILVTQNAKRGENVHEPNHRNVSEAFKFLNIIISVVELSDIIGIPDSGRGNSACLRR